MTSTDELLRRHLARMGASDAARTEPLTHLQLTMLRELVRLVQAACDDEGLDETVTRRIVERVIYGGTPSVAAAEYAQLLKDAVRTAAFRAPNIRS